MTAKDEIMKVYRHEPTELPCVVNDVNLVLPIPGSEVSIDPAGAYDMWGAHWTFEPEIMGFMATPGKIALDDITEWRDKITPPDLDAFDWEGFAKGVLPGLDPDKPTQLFTFPGIFERLHALMGMEEAMCSLLMEPEDCFDFFAMVADYKIEYLKRYSAVIPVDIVRFSDDYGNAQNLMMSLDTWRELIKPNLKRVVDAAHDLGLMFRQHTDGLTIPLMEDFVEIGIDAVDPWQACNRDIRACKDEYQDRIVFVNGFDNQGLFDQPGVTEEQIREGVLRTLEKMVPGGGYLAEFEVFDKSKLSIFRECVDEYNRLAA